MRDISAFLITNSTPLNGDTVSVPPSAKAPDLASGASVYGEAFCASCHAVQTAAGNLVGGNVGPELTRVGSKVKPEWLQAWLENPRVYDSGTQMPHYRFTGQQVSLLSGFLLNKRDADLLANVHLERQHPNRLRAGNHWFRSMAAPRATKSMALRGKRTSRRN